MTDSKKQAVTGAFGYTGQYITKRLLDKGVDVITLTNSTQRANPFGQIIQVSPFHFDKPKLLVETLTDVSVLYNTYWVRFNHKLFNFDNAVSNTLALFDAAKKAGVERIIHVSITNPSENSDLEYFRGKAVIERALKNSGMSYAILRPAVIFGGADILINNLAWMIRKFPLIVVFGDGNYRLQPIHVEDLAELAVRMGESRENGTIDAIGPETLTFRQLIDAIANSIGVKKPIFSVSPTMGYWLAKFLGKFVGDVLITRDEIKGLMNELLYVDSPPAGKIRLIEWMQHNRQSIGLRYAFELRRRVDKHTAYADLAN